MDETGTALTIIITICIFAIICRLVYMKGYRDGGKRILKEWEDFEGRMYDDNN